MARIFSKFSEFSISSGEEVRCFFAEFVGTAILVIFTCGTCMSSSSHADTLVATALSFGLTVACLVASIGHVSGCHINPAVTVGLLANGSFSLFRSIWYIMAQLLGAVAGAAILNASLVKKGNLCATVLRVPQAQGIIVEALICFLLVFVVCNACESNALNAPVLIGLAVTTGHLFAIPLTSSSMNTARSFGPAVVAGVWEDHYVYWVGPLVGGALGGLFHRFIFMNRNISKGELEDMVPKDIDGSISEQNAQNIITLSKITSM
ncbi:aquaporin AQPAe.a-like [Brevipalpus obovatus]|uniref:aquaporin AQPAe.a-like n=1 Tax=Brevipalpus obovatus TaxID=246614 RepID=UPI003D9F2373